MKFKNTTIPPEGRNKYGNYISSSEITKSVVRTTYNGNNSTGGNNPKTPEEEPRDIYTLFLSRSTLKFDSKKLLEGNVVETIDILGFVNSRSGDTFIGSLDVIPEEDIYRNNDYYDIIGCAEKGMTIGVVDNGTPHTKVIITCTSAATENEVRAGTLVIPCSVYKKSGDVALGPYLTDWASESDDCHTLYLELQWEISTLPPSNAYTLELTNELAAINCDASGNILTNAIRPTCQAMMYYGSDEVSGETYSISMDADRNAQGVSINTETGELTFGSNFSFDGTTLEVKITANYEGVIQTKVMTITKQFPGVDGTPATSRWVVPSANAITYNPNNGTISPKTITCKCMKQVGEDAPVEDTGTTIYYGYDTDNPLTKYSSAVSPDVSKSYLVFGIKNSAGVIYEIETIQIIKEGLNGQDGKDGADGTNGSNGESVYRLDLTNDNAGINADADGNIYSTAYKPTCTATLYYGTTKVTNATYSITTSPSATGVSINSTTGVITFGSNFNFSGTSLEITVTAMIGGVVYGTSIMTVSKNMAGKNGADGQDGVDGTDGINGEDGVSIVWKGTYTSHPSNPQNGWAYYNSAQKKSFIYQDNSWYQMTVDGTDGQDGTNGSDGLSIIWKGESSTAPSNPKLNWCYKDTDNGRVYIYNGTAWELMVLDGSDGEDGADGADGLSVYITYHDNAITSTPATPTGNGTTNGWHTTATKAANWMSQKVASAATAGTWGAPIQICGADGQDGADGSDGQDGADGQDAVTYWLEFSATAFQVNSAGTASPSTLTISAMKQVGGETPVDVTPTTTTGTVQIKYGFNTLVPSTGYTKNTSITINTAKNYITVQLYVNGTKYETETLPILHDGKNGSNGQDGADGAQGRQGPAVRGPVDWKDQTSTRRWCNGTLTNASYPEDGQFIDIVVYNGTYYQCKTSYNGKGSTTTAPSTTYWTAVDTQYKFVATNLLLAESAKINFTSSNELYLMDSDGNVTAGAAGGDSVNFWAGANEPENGAFKVYNNGTMEATKGKFGIVEIGKDEWDDGALYGTHIQNDGTKNDLSFQPHYFEMEATDPDDGTILESVRIAPYADPDCYDMDGIISVETYSDKRIGVFTSGLMYAEGYTKRLNTHEAFTPFSPLNNLEITFITDTNYFTKSNGYWLWKGMPLSKQYNSSTYGYVIKSSSGEWCFATSSTATSGIGTGIYTSSHIKQNNRLYIVI